MNSAAPSRRMISPNVATYQLVRRSRSRTSRWIPMRDELASVAKTVSGSPQCLNQLDRVLVVDLAPQPAYENLEHVRERIVVLVPDVRGDRGAIDDLAFVQHEELEQRELLGCQLDWLSRASYPVCVEVNFQVRDP